MHKALHDRGVSGFVEKETEGEQIPFVATITIELSDWDPVTIEVPYKVTYTGEETRFYLYQVAVDVAKEVARVLGARAEKVAEELKKSV